MMPLGKHSRTLTVQALITGWLLPGMTVAILVRPGVLDKVYPFSIDPRDVPRIDELVRSGDPLVVDPVSARRRAWEAAQAARQPAGASPASCRRCSRVR